LNTTVASTDALMKRLGVGAPKPPGSPAGEPFRIQDYTQTAAQLEATARQLTELIHALDRTLSPANLAQLSAQVAPAVQQVQAGGKSVVDYAFWRGVLLVAVILAAALIYRLVAARLLAAPRSKSNAS
jgi:hypothetical protein